MRWKRSNIVYIDTRWLFLKAVAVILLAVMLIAYWKWTRVTLIKFDSTDLAASWEVSDPKVIKQVSNGLNLATPAQGRPGKGSGFTMQLISRREVRAYTFYESGLIFDHKNNRLIKALKPLGDILQLAIGELRKRSPYGEPLDWKEVRKLFSVGSIAKVTNLDSGRKFSVRRTGGYSHADVEPLTARDTATVKMLYGSRWSWKRRAVVVETGGVKIAASLTGMPQGKGEMADNDCYGKFDLFFAGRAAEKSSNLAHLVMIWKAAGKTPEKLRGLSPEESLLVLFTALDQRDFNTLKHVIAPTGDIDKKACDLIGVTVIRMRKQTELYYQVTVSVSMQNGPYNQLRQVPIRLARDRNLEIYRADSAFLGILLRTKK